MRRKLYPSPAFLRSLGKVLRRNPQHEDVITATFEKLQDDAFQPRLRTRKLKGRLSRAWACSVAYDLRIVFHIVVADQGETILLSDIGTHEEVY